MVDMASRSAPAGPERMALRAAAPPGKPTPRDFENTDTPAAPAATRARRALNPAMTELFRSLTTTMFCAKDVTGAYVAVNDVFVARTNERTSAAVVGRTAPELFVAPLAARYESQDTAVLAGRTLRHELELIRRPGGTPGWYLTSKVPLRASAGQVVGVVSISEDLYVADESAQDLQAISRVQDWIENHLDAPIRVPDLAAVAGCSRHALERRIRRVFHLSPTQLVLRARIDRATEALTTSSAPISQIATACGFYDQAAFTRTFARVTGETPAQFRRRSAR